MIKDNIQYAYQPIVCLGTLQLMWYEALIRVPQVRSIEDYIIEQERLGTISLFDLNALDHVINHSLEKYRPFPQAIAVNVSPLSINDSEFRERALNLVRGKSPDFNLSLEITELSPITKLEETRAFVKNLQALGCSVGMDDIGSGHASIETVESLGLDYIKLSSKITEPVLRCKESQRIISDIVGYASQRSLPIVAEHIETREQYSWLKSAGCTLGQGWLFAKPSIPYTETTPFVCLLE